MLDSELFKSGKIYLIRTPINGNYGIPRLNGLVMGGKIGISLEDRMEEIYVVFVTKNLSRIKILHIDEVGISLTTRLLFNLKFRIMLEDESEPLQLNREQLRRLVLDGSYQGEWESRYLAMKLEENRQESRNSEEQVKKTAQSGQSNRQDLL